jgi:hypothetical protein
MIKLRQKISGAFRSFDALVDFCRIRGYVSTARKNRLNALDALRLVFLGNPFIPPPSTPRGRTRSLTITPAEDHALYLDKLPACLNPVFCLHSWGGGYTIRQSIVAPWWGYLSSNFYCIVCGINTASTKLNIRNCVMKHEFYKRDPLKRIFYWFYSLHLFYGST